jgi:glycosyltransferase involved in cell wall biosynthesis
MFCSIIVRSYKRPRELMQLLERLLRQSHRDHEIVVLDQSGDPALDAAVESLADPRIRLIKRPPLGAPGARNEAIRQARADILLFIDDDDLPLDDDWVAKHLRNYEDPDCLGVVGRLTSDPERIKQARFPRLVKFFAVSHTFFKDTREYAYGPLRKRGAAYLHGTNSSCRKELCARIGGWDEGVPPFGEEQSFAFKFSRDRRPGEYFVYDPEPLVWRRPNVAGGGERRSGGDWYRRELAARVIYYHGIVGHYFPIRFRLLYPLYLMRTAVKIVEWIWDRDNGWRTRGERLRASLMAPLLLPATLWRHGWRAPHGAIRRVQSL